MSNLKRFTIVYTGMPGLPGTNTWYFHENGHTFDDQAAALEAFYTALLPTYAYADLTATFDGTGQIIDSTNGDITGTDTATPWDTGGTLTNDPLPYATQLVVQLRTGTYFGGRELRGRAFIPGFTEANSLDGSPDSTLVAAAADAIDVLAGAALAVYSPTKKEWASVNSSGVYPEWAVLRSRRP